jgi:hypothetical protein
MGITVQLAKPVTGTWLGSRSLDDHLSPRRLILPKKKQLNSGLTLNFYVSLFKIEKRIFNLFIYGFF